MNTTDDQLKNGDPIVSPSMPTTAWLTDPRVYAVHRLDAHSDHACWSHAPVNGEVLISGRALTANGGSASRRADGPFPRWDERRVASVRRVRLRRFVVLPRAGALASGDCGAACPQYVNVQYHGTDMRTRRLRPSPSTAMWRSTGASSTRMAKSPRPCARGAR